MTASGGPELPQNGFLPEWTHRRAGIVGRDLGVGGKKLRRGNLGMCIGNPRVRLSWENLPPPRWRVTRKHERHPKQS